jgi:hypothetical protein
LDGELHIIKVHPEGKHKYCALCLAVKIPGGRREIDYFLIINKRLHMDNFFKSYHMLQN